MTAIGTRIAAWTRDVRSQRLVVYAMLLFLLIALAQVTASLTFYEAIHRDALHEDHARRVAELLVVSDRLHRQDPALTAPIMSSRYLDARVSARPSVAKPGETAAVSRIHRHIVEWEPALGTHPLTLDIVRGDRGGRDLVGSMRLEGGSWLNFRSRNLSAGWPIVLRATSVTLGLTLLCVVLGLCGLHWLTRPLRRLSEALSHLTNGDTTPMDERGPAEVRSLVRSFNAMRTRICDLEENQSRSFEAISHDLRTPISRLVIAADFVPDNDISRIVRSSAEEMEAMLMSLQSFLRAQHLESVAEDLDLVPLVADVLRPFGSVIVLDAPATVPVTSFREPLVLALRPLVENALQYGTRAWVTIRSDGDDWRIEIADDGPGIPEEDFEAVLDPFFRGDAARARDTRGFGLGIPTAHCLLTRFGGALHLRRGATGGTVIGMVVPRARD